MWRSTREPFDGTSGRSGRRHISGYATEALKHGMSAKMLVLPGEDPEAFQDRIETWTALLGPENDLEQYLAEHAAQSSWQLDRAQRAEAARRAAAIRHAPADEALHPIND